LATQTYLEEGFGRDYFGLGNFKVKRKNWRNYYGRNQAKRAFLGNQIHWLLGQANWGPKLGPFGLGFLGEFLLKVIG